MRPGASDRSPASRLPLLSCFLLFFLASTSEAHWLFRRNEQTSSSWKRTGIKRCRARGSDGVTPGDTDSSPTSVSEFAAFSKGDGTEQEEGYEQDLLSFTDEEAAESSEESDVGSSDLDDEAAPEAGQGDNDTSNGDWCPAIWSDSGPSFNDVSQNYGADDCSLLSAAASLAWADPEALKSLFKPLECGKDRNEGMVVRVSLFDFSQDEAPSREFAIPVTQTSESFVVDGQARDANSWSWTAGGPIWVGIIEAAFERMTGGSRLSHLHQALKALTGKEPRRVEILGEDWDRSLLSLARDHPMVTQTSTMEPTTSELFHGHAYSVFSGNGTYATFRNPWGYTASADSSIPDSSVNLAEAPEFGNSVFRMPISHTDGPGTVVEQSGGLIQVVWVE